MIEISTDDEIKSEIQKETTQNAIINEEMYAILRKIQKGNDISEVLSKLGDPVFDSALEQCCRSGYISGIYPTRVASGRLTVDRTSGVGITKDGERLIYLRSLRNN